jgi:phosphopantothenoylcysteine decarboxylase/phosphopantothenate--cysteine ligase
MHTEMWEHPAVRENLETLVRRGVRVVQPAAGRLAGGDVGQGRLADPVDIVGEVARVLTPPSLAGRKVVVSAGGTREPIDPVRFISNRSSGKQGYALAEEAAARGATVTLVTTVNRPVSLGVDTVEVETAAQMHDAMVAAAQAADVVVMAAAVADYAPVERAGQKMPKDGETLTLVLRKTPDILGDLGQRRVSKGGGPLLVGFAAETENVVAHATVKREKKHADLIVANDVSRHDAGFDVDTNAVTIVGPGGAESLPVQPKSRVAGEILDRIERLIVAGPAKAGHHRE